MQDLESCAPPPPGGVPNRRVNLVYQSYVPAFTCTWTVPHESVSHYHRGRNASYPGPPMDPLVLTDTSHIPPGPRPRTPRRRSLSLRPLPDASTPRSSTTAPYTWQHSRDPKDPPDRFRMSVTGWYYYQGYLLLSLLLPFPSHSPSLPSRPSSPLYPPPSPSSFPFPRSPTPRGPGYLQNRVAGAPEESRAGFCLRSGTPVAVVPPRTEPPVPGRGTGRLVAGRGRGGAGAGPGRVRGGDGGLRTSGSDGPPPGRRGRYPVFW